MQEHLEEFESIPRRKNCNQPCSLTVCSAAYFCRVDAWVNCKIVDLYILGVRRPDMALSLSSYVRYLLHRSVNGLIKMVKIHAIISIKPITLPI